MVKSEVDVTINAEEAPVASGPKPAKKKKKKKKKNKPGKYSVLVLDAVKKLNERSGSSLVKIYNEAKKASWFDEQNGRTYLRYSIRALVLNNTLIQVKGMGANGSFRLNEDKFAKEVPKKTQSKPAKTTTKTAKASTTKKATVKPKAKSSPKKAPDAKKPAAKMKKLGVKKVIAAQKNKKPKKASKPPAKSPRKK
uniref:Histone H1x n=1 Tax=Oncorhynchus mykiss TaxID=8022 RepID=C1BF13_ONCMY|nr:Histone H1x [Oncorhynchus mykiss]ACO08689.1 Histone H1x [Oncorhynchus mykiss]